MALPSFEFNSGFSLRHILESLGMSAAFNEFDADFSGIAYLKDTEPNLFIHDVIHGTYITVDEQKTEAAAATGTVVALTAPPPDPDPFEFVADRPLLFAIRDAPTDAVLFLGRVVDASPLQDELDAPMDGHHRGGQDREEDKAFMQWLADLVTKYS